MSMTLSEMRTILTEKANQSGTSNLVWSDSELDNYIRSGIRFVIDRGRIDLFSDDLILSAALVSAGSGLYSKPTSYFRFISAIIESNYTDKLYPMSFYSMIEGNDILAGNSSNNNIYDYDNNYFLVTPTSSVLTVKIKYVKELQKSDFSADTDVSPLKDTGNDYAIDYAYGLLLIGKLYQPEIGKMIINDVIQRIV